MKDILRRFSRWFTCWCGHGILSHPLGLQCIRRGCAEYQE